VAIISTDVQGLGHFEVPARLVDRAIEDYLPASAAQLKTLVEERTGEEFLERPVDVATLLVVLASFYPDNPR
jgi:hypothetical protein